MEFNPLGKDAKPSPARQFGPGTSGGRWQHRLPFCFWAAPSARPHPLIANASPGRGAFNKSHRHCEERSDAAIQQRQPQHWMCRCDLRIFASLAMTIQD